MAALHTEVRKWPDELLAVCSTCLKILKRSLYQHMEPIMKRDMNDLIREIAPDYFRTGELQEGVSTFLEKRRTDLSPFR